MSSGKKIGLQNIFRFSKNVSEKIGASFGFCLHQFHTHLVQNWCKF